MQVRKFLKKVGISSQRHIETAVEQAVKDGKIAEGDEITATMTLSIPKLEVSVEIQDRIKID